MPELQTIVVSHIDLSAPALILVGLLEVFWSLAYIWVWVVADQLGVYDAGTQSQWWVSAAGTGAVLLMWPALGPLTLLVLAMLVVAALPAHAVKVAWIAAKRAGLVEAVQLRESLLKVREGD